MGLAQDVHAAAARYEDGARTAVLIAHEIAGTVAELEERLAAHGTLGASTDPDLARARARLTTARQRLLAASEAARSSQEEVRAYADRVFPL